MPRTYDCGGAVVRASLHGARWLIIAGVRRPGVIAWRPLADNHRCASFGRHCMAPVGG
jgi:hypothetical protein